MIEYSRYGGRSSMAERLTVDQVVEGSSPFAHPYVHKFIDISISKKNRWLIFTNGYFFG